MLPPFPSRYMWRSAARVVRNAPSRWTESSCFHFENGSSSIGATVCMPALLTRISRRPYRAMTFSIPASTCSSSETFIATASAVLSPEMAPISLNSFATALAASPFRSATTTLAPSRANVSAISLPMPLAAPVIIATLFFNRMRSPLTVTKSFLDHPLTAERRLLSNVASVGRIRQKAGWYIFHIRMDLLDTTIMSRWKKTHPSAWKQYLHSCAAIYPIGQFLFSKWQARLALTRSLSTFQRLPSSIDGD